MSKKEKAPSTPESRAQKLADKQEVRKAFKKTFFPAIAVCLSVLLIYSLCYMAFLNPAKGADVQTNSNTPTQTSNNNNNNPGGSDSTDNQTPDSSDNTSDPAGSAENADPANSDSQAPASGSEVDQAISLYKTGWEKATTASSAITHTKTGATNYNNIVEAGGLSSAAETLMGMFMKSSEPNEVIDKSALPPKGGVSNLSASNVKSVEIKEEGNLQVVKIYLNDKVNPVAGDGGIGSAVNVIEESQITGSISSVPGLKISNINVAYENVYVEFKVDKATGNMTYLYLDAPCILSLSAKLAVVSIDNAKVGIECIDEYVIDY